MARTIHNGHRATRAFAALPFILLLAALLLWPLGVLALRSLSGDTGFGVGEYLAVITTPRYWRALFNTLLLALVSTTLALVICIPAAVYIELGDSRDRRVLAVLLSIPLSLPGIVIGFFVILYFGNAGVVPQLFEILTGERQLNIAYSFGGLLLGYVYFQIPRVVLVVRGAVAGIAPETLAVARTLGAAAWRVYLHVVLPTLRPAILSAAALSMATALGAFGTAATLSRGYRVLPLEIAAAFTERFEPGRAAALSVLLALGTTLFLVAANRLALPRTTARDDS